MFSIIVEERFNALHRVTLPNGSLEPLHGHDWLVRVHFCRPELDARGMVMDFHEAREGLQKVLSSLHLTCLNESAFLQGRTPTAEVVAEQLFRALSARGLHAVRRVEVVEAPGCVAAYEPPAPTGGQATA